MTIGALDLKDIWPFSLVAWRLEKVLDNVVSESQNEFDKYSIPIKFVVLN